MKKLLLCAIVSVFACVSFVSPSSASGNKFQEITGPDGQKTTFERLSYDEAMSRIAERTGKPIKEVRKDNPDLSKRVVGVGKSSARPMGPCSYGEYSTRFTVTPSYKPSLVVSAYACRQGSFGWVEKIQFADIKRNWNGTTKNFQGKVETWVTDDKQGLHYIINGDFYNYGSTTVGAQVGKNTDNYSVSFNASVTSNHYSYYNSGTRYMSVTGQ